ncbi:TonB-dependent receptor [Chitinophaga vietnamensis]|uniref:TonB-dependent receptor n=1 Tax=Chitinophaga vietnamensis TaxID=2593957 RepID=UPI001177F2C0|nr:TonB-dependent receptor [Chitinophaga vietnamensis]
MILVTGSRCVLAQQRLLERRFTCHAAKGSVPFLLARVSADSHAAIEYAAQYLEGGSPMELKEGETTLGQVLNGLLAGRKVKVDERNGKIMLIPADLTLAVTKVDDHYNLFGYTKEESSLEPLPYAVITDLESGQACQSNMFGYYSLRLTQGMHHVKIMQAGRPPQVAEVFISGPTRKNFTLSPTLLPEVKVSSGNMLQKDGGSNMEKYLSSTYNNMLGESDPVRSLYLMPGNIESQETAGRLMVRGGDPEQSIFLLDGNRVFNPTHLLGEISIINESSLKSIRQFKNDFPTRFDGALSSVTEVNTKDGSMDKWGGELNASLLAAAAAIEGPLQKGRTSMMASFRQSWSNPLLNVLDSNYRLRFHDIHFKVTHLFDNNNKVMFSGYLGGDRLQLKQEGLQNFQVWGNRLATINWNHVIGPRAFMNTTLNVSNYHNLAGFKLTFVDDSTGEVKESKAYNNYASIARYEAKTQFEFNAFARTQFHFGAKVQRMVIRPFNTNISSELQEETGGYKPMDRLPFTEMSLYYENEFRLGRRLLIRPGVNFSTYWFRDYRYSALQPRFFAAYRINKYQQLTFAYARMGQYLHQVSSPALGVNSELWVPSTSILQPAENDLFDLGYHLHNDKGILLSANLYYRKMNNVTNFANKGNVFYNQDTWEQDITTGKGWSYGAELLAAKRMKRWQLQLAYTLSWSWRQFDDVNNGEKFPFRYDRRHILSLAANYRPDKHWDLGMIWLFSTGDWIPPQVGTLPDIEGDNNAGNFQYRGSSYYDRRAPARHQLNCNVNYYFNTGTLKHKISTGLYNAIHSRASYPNEVWNVDNGSFTVSDKHVFNLTYYLSYTLSF